MTQQMFRSIVIVLAGLLIASSAQAQQQPAMSTNDMMTPCREFSSESIDQVMAMMSDAERSNDHAMMRQALQEAQKRLKGTRQHMSSCMSMMERMEQMQGGRQAEGTSGMMQESQGVQQGMLGMFCCPPAGVAGVAAMAIGSLLALSLTAALIALTVFLWNRSRTARTRV